GIRDRTVTGVQTCALPISSVQNRFAPNGYPNDEPRNAPFRPNTTELPIGLSRVVRRTRSGLPGAIGGAHAATGFEGVGGGGGVEIGRASCRERGEGGGGGG